jgi:hypothetical protein
MFAEGNIGAVEGTELLNALGLDGWEIQKPDVWSKYLEIAKYFEKFADGANIARLVARSSPKGEKLNKVLEYMSLRKQLDAVREQRALLPNEDTVSGETPEALELQNQENKLIQEIRLYE